MVTKEKKVVVAQILLFGIFGIDFEMTEMEKELHKKFLLFHIDDFYNDFEKVLVSINKTSRMLLEKLLYEFKKPEVIKADFNISDESFRNGVENTFKILRNPKYAKHLVKYADENWQDFIDKDFQL